MIHQAAVVQGKSVAYHEEKACCCTGMQAWKQVAEATKCIKAGPEPASGRLPHPQGRCQNAAAATLMAAWAGLHCGGATHAAHLRRVGLGSR